MSGVNGRSLCLPVFVFPCTSTRSGIEVVTLSIPLLTTARLTRAFHSFLVILTSLFTKMSIFSLFGYLLLAGTAEAFWRLPCKTTLVVERSDPIVAPGNVSGHVHQIMGGNAFDFEMDYADTQSSTCTSCTVHGDFSNYWTPILYYQHQDGTFEKVDQVGGALVYYLQRSGPNKDKLQAFPEGLRMVAGDPFKRSAGNDFASQAISYNCLDYNKNPGNPETPGFPKINCPNGLRSQVFFPSCWDGKNLDSADHKSHMSYPIGAYNDGKCPDTHPVHLVSIFYEIIWDTGKFSNKWYGNDQPFLWAQGDPTGYGFHGDFLMGWDRSILQKAVDQCTSDSGRVEDCPVFQLYPDSVAEGCKLASKIDEDVQGPFAKLPGCNPVQKGPDRAQIIMTCDGNNATIGQGKSFFKDLTSSGWGYQGCGTDNYYSRALTGASTSQTDMTNDKCVKYCGDKGFSIAATEYSKECYCGNSIPISAQAIPGVVGNCDMACAGDANQFCGGSGRLSLYQKCSGSSCVNAAGLGDSKPAGSASTNVAITSSTNAANTAQQTKTQVVQTTTTTTSMQARNSASATSSSASKPSSSTVASTSLSAVNPSSLPQNWSYIACYADTVNPRTLPKLAPYTLDGKPVTSASCVSYCSSNGYKFAGTEYAGECWCGNSLPANASKLDPSKCMMSCKGDFTQSCGGSAALSLFADTSKVTQSSSKRNAMADIFDLTQVKEHMKRHESKRYGRAAL